MKNNIVYLLGSMVGAGIPFLFLPILTRVLSPEEYGVMNLLFTLYSICVPITSIGVSSYLQRVYFDERKLPYNTFIKCIKLVGFWTLILILLTFPLTDLFISKPFQKYAVIFPFLVLSASLNSIFMVRLLLYNAEGSAKTFVFFQLLYTSVIFIVTLCFLFYFELAELSRLYGIILVDIVFVFISIYLLKKSLDPSIKSKNNVEIDFLKYGVGLVPHIIASILLSSLDKLIVASYMTMEDLASYVISVQFASILMVFSQGLSKEWTRVFMRAPYHKSINSRALNICLMLLAVGTVLYLSKDIFYWFFVGENFIINDRVSLILIMSQLFHCFYMIISVHISYEKKTYILSIMTIISLLINFVISILLIDYFGLVAVAIGTLSGMAVKFFLTLYYVYRRRIMVQLDE